MPSGDSAIAPIGPRGAAIGVKRAVLQIDGVDRLVELIGVRLGRRRRDQPVAVGRRTRSVRCGTAPVVICFSARDPSVEHPDPRQTILFLRDARIVLVLLALLLRLGLRLGHQQRDARAVRRPAERVDPLLAIGQLARRRRRASAADRAAPRRRDRRGRRSMRPSGAQRGDAVALGRERQLADAAAGDVEHPEIALPRGALHRLGDGEDEPRVPSGESSSSPMPRRSSVCSGVSAAGCAARTAAASAIDDEHGLLHNLMRLTLA